MRNYCHGEMLFKTIHVFAQPWHIDTLGPWSRLIWNFEILNSNSLAAKLTTRVEQHSIDFLGITIYKATPAKETGLLNTKVFFKRTDTHRLLHKSSFHPKHTFAGVLKYHIVRFYMICSDRIWSCMLSLIQYRYVERTRLFKTFLEMHQKPDFTEAWHW